MPLEGADIYGMGTQVSADTYPAAGAPECPRVQQRLVTLESPVFVQMDSMRWGYPVAFHLQVCDTGCAVFFLIADHSAALQTHCSGNILSDTMSSVRRLPGVHTRSLVWFVSWKSVSSRWYRK